MYSQTENHVCQEVETISRPKSLARLIFVADIFLIFAALASLGAVFEGNPIGIAALVGPGVLIFLLHKLHKGRYWAWVAVQVFLGISIIIMVGIYFSSPGGLWGVGLFETAIVVAALAALIVYLRGEKVREFCSCRPLNKGGKQDNGQSPLPARPD